MFIELNSKRFRFKDLHSITPSSPFEQETLDFINNWISGEKMFELTTSGSTGKPKSFIISREKMELSAISTLKALKINKKGTSLVCLNTQFIAGKMMLVRSLINEMNIIAIEPTSNPFANISNDQTLALTAMVPLQIETTLDFGVHLNQLNNTRAILLGGAPVGDVLREKLQSLESKVYETYGMTETVSHIALKHINGKETQDYFKILPNVEIGMDERECLTIRSVLTDNQTFKTNDIVELIDESRFRWVGRYDNVINSGGLKLQSEKLEAEINPLLTELGINNRFFCYGIPDQKLGQKVALIIEGEIENKEKVLDYLKNRLQQYHEPKEILTSTKFIETPTKKIQRKSTVDNIISSPPSV